MHAYLKTYSNFYAEFRSIGIFEIYFTIQKISVKAFTIFNSILQSFVKWAAAKINHFCFFAAGS